MKRQIDIFGDKNNIYDDDKLPNELINENGKWIRDKGATVGTGYILTEPSQAFLDKYKDVKFA